MYERQLVLPLMFSACLFVMSKIIIHKCQIIIQLNDIHTQKKKKLVTLTEWHTEYNNTQCTDAFGYFLFFPFFIYFSDQTNLWYEGITERCSREGTRAGSWKRWTATEGMLFFCDLCTLRVYDFIPQRSKLFATSVLVKCLFICNMTSFFI